MAIDVANSNRYVFYLNFRTIGDGTNFCESEQNFSFAELIDDASKYVLSVERFRVPLQSIEMFPETDNAITFLPKDALPLRTLDLLESYSLHDFIQQMNKDDDLTFSLGLDGRARIAMNFDDFSLQLTKSIAEVLDMDANIGLTLTGDQIVVGASPIFDRFDQLFKIQIEGQLGLAAVQQEIIDTNIFQNLLTDFIVPSTFSMTSNYTIDATSTNSYALTAPLRQDLVFNQAANRRYIMFRTQTPIQNVKIEITAIYRDGTRHRIRMPRRSMMECKLAFWRK